MSRIFVRGSPALFGEARYAALPALALCLLSVFWLGGCEVWDALTRCRHEYTGFEVDSDGNRTDRYNYVCDRDDDTEDVVVGVVIPVSGPSEKSGADMRKGFELAREEINGSALLDKKKIRFVFKDSQGDPARAASAFESLVREGVPAILGPATSSATERIVPVVNRNRVVTISPTSAARGLGGQSDYLFRVNLNIARLSKAGVKVTRERLGYRRAATVTNSADAFSRSSDEEIRKALAENGVGVVSAQTFSRRPGAAVFPDLTAQLRAVTNADPPPDVLFISAQPPGKTKVMSEARRLGLGAGVRFVSSYITANEIEDADGAAEGAVSFTSWSAASDAPLNAGFVRSYRAKHKRDPTVFSALSYAAVYVLAEAIADASSADSRSIRGELETIDLNTVLGRLSFDEDGDAVYDPVVETVRNGRLEVFGNR